MQEIKLKAIRIFELSGVIDSITPKDLATVKDIRLTSNLVNDLQGACSVYTDKIKDLYSRQQEVVKLFQERYIKESEGLSEDAKKELGVELDNKLKLEIEEKFGGEAKALSLEGEEECTFSIDNEKFDKLKELFEKYSAEKYTKKDVILEVAKALGI